MAAIDKIYVLTLEQYNKFKEWCGQQPPLTDKYGTKVSIMGYVYDYDEDFEPEHDFPVFNAPYYVDAYVIRNCPLGYIQEELMLNYGHKSPKRVKEMYETVKNRTPEEQKAIEESKGLEDVFCVETPDGRAISFWWLTLDDFIVDGETITLKNPDKSSYDKILAGELYNSPCGVTYTPGKHCRMVDSPHVKFERPYKGPWFVGVELPEDIDEPYMWFHTHKDGSETWDFPSDFVDTLWSSSCATVKTITALKRKICGWKLPVGSRVIATGRYYEEKYEFVVTK